MPDIAVLANGPSLTRVWKEAYAADYQTVIGTNTAAYVFAVDVWCWLDPVVFDEFPAGKNMPTTICTHAHNRVPSSITRVEPPWYDRRSKHLPKGYEAQTGVNACNFTFPNAIALAALYAGPAGRVDVYGMDYTGALDVAGAGGVREGDRWFREMKWLTLVWRSHWRIFGEAPSFVRDCLEGRAPLCEVRQQVLAIKQTCPKRNASRQKQA